MKIILLNRVCFVFALVVASFCFQSCNTNHYKPLQHKWHITTDEAMLELNSDSTFTFSQQNAKYSGKWKLEDNGKTIVFKEKGKAEKKMAIKKVTDEVLILSDNGDEQDYVKAD